MKFDVITLFPDLIENYFEHSIAKRATESEIIKINTINPRDFSTNKHKKVDDEPYGGGAGMVLMCEPIFGAYESIEKSKNKKTILLTPQGKTFDHNMSVELSSIDQIIMICGHYEGFDERIRQGIDCEEVSVGDFVMTGGEPGAICIIDSVIRNIEGVLGKIESAHYDSFSDGLLEYPHYTRPYNFKGKCVPDILRSGNHKEIEKWRRKQQIIRTKKQRPDLFEIFLDSKLSKQDKIIINEINKEEQEK